MNRIACSHCSSESVWMLGLPSEAISHFIALPRFNGGQFSLSTTLGKKRFAARHPRPGTVLDQGSIVIGHALEESETCKDQPSIHLASV